MTAETETSQEIAIDHVKELLVEQGFEVKSTQDTETFQVRDLESGLTITCVLQDNILFNTLPCFNLDKNKLSVELATLLLSSDNGISTSHFQIYEASNDQYRVTLNNFCKLQDLGPEDKDDILSCITFLEVDAMAARHILADKI